MASEKRLIDVDARIEEIKKAHCTICESYGGIRCRACWVDDVIGMIDDSPTVDAVEVVHGRWEKASEKMPIYRCSICKERNLFKNGYNVFSNYCPNCGAKMDGERKDNDK